MDLGLQDRVALVAASSKGLGRAVATELARENARVIMCARDTATLEQAGTEIRRETGSEVEAITADLTSAEGTEAMVQAGVDRFGPIEILVTNAGGPPSGTFDALSPEQWDDAIDLNLRSVLRLVRLVLPGMRVTKWGRILNVTSISVKQPVANLMLSNSIRAAVTGFARTLADEVAADGITVNNILPGYTRTERVEQLAKAIGAARGASAAAAIAEWEGQIPMRRLGRVEEFAALAAFLVSERASYITGVSVPVDGGWTRSLY